MKELATMNRPDDARPRYLLLALAFIGFISLGLPDAVTGVAWPSVRDTFHLRQGAVGIVLVISGAGYLLSSFFAGRLMDTCGIGLILAVSTGLVAAAMFGFGLSPVWTVFLFCALVHGLGSGAIDSGLNGYAAHHMSARQLIWLHACYCFGALIGPVVMSRLLASGRHYSAGYATVGGTMLVMSVMFLLTCRVWGEGTRAAEKQRVVVSYGAVLRHSAVWLQMAVFFLYTGLEVTFSQWTYTVLTESRNVSPDTAGAAVGVYWGSVGFGRVVSGVIADRVGIDRLLRYCLIGAGSGGVSVCRSNARGNINRWALSGWLWTGSCFPVSDVPDTAPTGDRIIDPCHRVSDRCRDDRSRRSTGNAWRSGRSGRSGSRLHRSGAAVWNPDSAP
jgi:fucose permease